MSKGDDCWVCLQLHFTHDDPDRVKPYITAARTTYKGTALCTTHAVNPDQYFDILILGT